jgi:hypothetical protein
MRGSGIDFFWVNTALNAMSDQNILTHVDAVADPIWPKNAGHALCILRPAFSALPLPAPPAFLRHSAGAHHDERPPHHPHGRRP